MIEHFDRFVVNSDQVTIHALIMALIIIIDALIIRHACRQ